MMNAVSPSSCAAALLACMTVATAACSGDGTSSSTTSGGGGATSSSAAVTSSQSTSAGGVTGAATGTGTGTGTGGLNTSTGTSTGSSGTGGGASAAAGTIVPLYSNPTDPAWTAIVAAKKAHPSVTVRAIINPDSGPGASKDPGYVTGIAALDAAGIVVLGYVATTYGKKAPAAAHAEMATYKTWYPGVKGIFFDEMSNKVGDEPYYQGLDYYAKGTGGYAVTVGNPGTDVPASFVGTVDTILIYESEGLPTVSSLDPFSGKYNPKNFGVIPYGVPALDAAFVAGARAHVGFIYLTDDGLPNPWDALPPYFAGLLAALE